MPAASGKRLGRILVQSGLLTERQLEKTIAEAGDLTLTQAVVMNKLATEAGIARAVAEQTGLDYVDVAMFEIDANASTLLSPDLAHRYSVLPIAFDEGKLVVAMSDPANIFAIDDLRIVTGYEIKPVVASEGDLKAAIDKYSGMQDNVDEMVGDVAESLATVVSGL